MLQLLFHRQARSEADTSPGCDLMTSEAISRPHALVMTASGANGVKGAGTAGRFIKRVCRKEYLNWITCSASHLEVGYKITKSQITFFDSFSLFLALILIHFWEIFESDRRVMIM